MVNQLRFNVDSEWCKDWDRAYEEARTEYGLDTWQSAEYAMLKAGGM